MSEDCKKPACAMLRQVGKTSDLLRIVTPQYRVEIAVPHGSGCASVVGLERGELLSAASMKATAHQTAGVNSRSGIRNRLKQWLIPHIARVVCTTCGPARTVETRVSLPVMVSHRRTSCSSGGCAIYRKRFGLSICPRRLGGCGCLLNLKWLVAGAHCPAGRW